MSANAVIYKKHHSLKDSTSLPSTIATSLSYSQKSQIIAPVQATLYFNNNKTILLSDWRYLKYPTYTFGLGMNSSPDDSLLLSYQYFKFHQSALFQIQPHMYIGGGYDLDYFWQVRENTRARGTPVILVNMEWDTGRGRPASLLIFLYDTRDNPIYPHRGNFVNVIFSPRFKFLGSDEAGPRCCWSTGPIFVFLQTRLIYLRSGVITG